MESIYIAIPSMEDTEISITVENAILSAEYPERIFIGVSIKDLSKKEYNKVLDLSKKYNNISVEFIKLNKKDIYEFGTGDGRYRSHQMYSGQDYILQVDSHTLFENNWDSYLIKLFKECKQELGLEKIVLTSYIPFYSYSPERKKNDKDFSHTRYPFYIVDDFFLDYLPMWDDRNLKDNEKIGKFIPCVKFNGAFAFGDKEFVKNSGVFKDAVFYDEELIQSINLIGNDFALVFPNVENFPIAHLASIDINNFGGKRTYFSDMLNDKRKKMIALRTIDNYINFIKDPKNNDIVKKYEKYAKIDLNRGAIVKDYIPKKFVVED